MLRPGTGPNDGAIRDAEGREEADRLHNEADRLHKGSPALREKKTQIVRVEEQIRQTNEAIGHNNVDLEQVVKAVCDDAQAAAEQGGPERIWLALHAIHAAYAKWMRTHWNRVDPRRYVKQKRAKPSTNMNSPTPATPSSAAGANGGVPSM